MPECILIVTNLYQPLMRGGAERVAMAQAEALAREGHRVVVLTTGMHSEIIEQGGVEVHRFAPALPYHILNDRAQPFWARCLWHAKDLWPTTSARVARALIAQVKPDRIILHNMRGMGLGAWRACVRAGVPVEQVWHDAVGVVPSGLLWVARHTPVWQWAPVRFAYAWWLQAWIGKGLAMHFPSQALCDLYRRHGWARCFGAVRVERNVVAPFDTESPVSADIEELMSRARERGTRVWGFVGYMTESKGPDVALRAAARCTQPGELWMVGDGPERLALQAWAERHMPAHVHVRWLGQRPRHELFALLASMRVLLVPSLVWENCPGVVLEAQAVGTRVLGSDAGGFVELLPSADRLPPGDVAAWARAMCA